MSSITSRSKNGLAAAASERFDPPETTDCAAGVGSGASSSAVAAPAAAAGSCFSAFRILARSSSGLNGFRM